MKNPERSGNIMQRLLQFNLRKDDTENLNPKFIYSKGIRTAWEAELNSKKANTSSISSDFQKFCHESSLHGLIYIGQPRLHILERIFWCIAFLLGILAAGALIRALFTQFNRNPVIVTFGASQTSIDQVPFPAVTICNVNNAKKSQIANLIRWVQEPDTYPNETNFYRNCLYHLDHVCMSTARSFSSKLNFSSEGSSMDSIPAELAESIKNHAAKSRHNQSQVERILFWAAQRCEAMIIFCRWEDETKNCKELFRPIVTDYGVCCTFNMAPPERLQKFEFRTKHFQYNAKADTDWKWNKSDLSIEGLLLSPNSQDEEVSEFPHRSKRSGLSYGLSFLLDPDIGEYFCTSSDSTGFHLVNHLPTESAHVSEYGLGIGPELEAFIKVTADITVADPAINFLEPKNRKCYLPGEHTLKYYLIYTYGNCFDECLANVTYGDCGCVRYFMTRDDSRKLCAPGVQNECADRIKKEFVGAGEKGRCPECLPTCTDISYLTEMTTRPMRNDKSIWRRYNASRDEYWASRNVSLVNVYFGEGKVYPKIRKRLYSVTDLIAGTGGLLGLCLGFSVLSGIELVYFLVTKVFWKHLIRRWMNRNTTAVSEFENSNNSDILAIIGRSAVDEIMSTRKNLELNKENYSKFY